MLVLFDSPAGHCLFKVMDSGLLKKPEDIWDAFTSAESAKKACAALCMPAAVPQLDSCRERPAKMWWLCDHRVKLKAFHKFEDTAEAVQSATAIVEARAHHLHPAPHPAPAQRNAPPHTQHRCESSAAPAPQRSVLHTSRRTA